MEKRVLQSMVDYVLNFDVQNIESISTGPKCMILDKINNYAKFLSMPLTEEIVLICFKGFYKHHGTLYCPNQVDLINLNEDYFKTWHTVEWLLNNTYQEIEISKEAVTKYKI